MAEHQAIWLFDAVCIFCSRGVQYTLAHEIAPNIQFVAIQSARGRQIAIAHELDPDDPESFIFIDGGHAHFKSDGVIALADHLCGPARLLKWGRFFPRPLRDWAYMLVAKNRYRWFGQSQTCIAPAPEHASRFVLPT